MPLHPGNPQKLTRMLHLSLFCLFVPCGCPLPQSLPAAGRKAGISQVAPKVPAIDATAQPRHRTEAPPPESPPRVSQMPLPPVSIHLQLAAICILIPVWDHRANTSCSRLRSPCRGGVKHLCHPSTPRHTMSLAHREYPGLAVRHSRIERRAGVSGEVSSARSMPDTRWGRVRRPHRHPTAHLV